jgi:hypothetical protein
VIAGPADEVPGGVTAEVRKVSTRRSFSRRVLEHLAIGGFVLAALTVAGGTALAQSPPTADQGPRFGQWGPGQAAPAPEGPPSAANEAPRGSAPEATPPVGRAPGAPGPFLAPPTPEYAPAPGYGGGCQHDLRGNWQIMGRQTDPYSYPYQAWIQVRQFRQWLQIDQPEDGISYYGVCRGDRIELDVYSGDRFIGYQDGNVTRDGWSPWQPRRGTRVSADWVSFAGGYAVGHETWRRW